MGERGDSGSPRMGRCVLQVEPIPFELGLSFKIPQADPQKWLAVGRISAYLFTQIPKKEQASTTLERSHGPEVFQVLT